MKAEATLTAALWKTAQALACAALILLGCDLRSSSAQPATRDVNIVVIWPAAGPMQGVGVNGKVVWPRAEAGRRVPTGNTVIIWPRAAQRP